MLKLTDLSPFASNCLQFIKENYPQFNEYIVPSDYNDNGWSSEIPWPNGWEAVGLMVGTRINLKWEVLRIDFGNMDDELFPHTYKNIEELLLEAGKIIDDILNENTVLIAKWIKPNEYIGKWTMRDYLPQNDKELWGAKEIWMRSWRGTYNQEWNLK